MSVLRVRKELKSWLGAVMGAVCHVSGLSLEWSPVWDEGGLGVGVGVNPAVISQSQCAG